MATKDNVNGIIDAIKMLITTNVTSLGGTARSPVIEGDEEPMYIEETSGFPSFYVVPLVEGGDKISTHMGGDYLQTHEFSVTVVGFYKSMTVSDLMRSVRNYGYAFADLIAGKHLKGIGFAGYLLDPVLEVGYWRVGDYIVHSWIVKFTVKTKGG